MNEAWYFCAREGDQGPWRSEAEARRECARFIKEKTELAPFQQARDAEREEAAKAAAQAARIEASKVTKLEVLPIADKVEVQREPLQLMIES